MKARIVPILFTAVSPVTRTLSTTRNSVNIPGINEFFTENKRQTYSFVYQSARQLKLE